MFQELTKKLTEVNTDNYLYSCSDICRLTNYILETVSFYPGHCATPIIKVAKEFGFVLYQEDIGDNEYGKIYIGEESISRYNKEMTIVVKKNISRFQQRYMVALQLGNYLLKYLGAEKRLAFMESLTDHQLKQFVFEIMMPRELFREQYLIASKSGNPMFVETYLSRYFEMPIGCVMDRIASMTGRG